MFSVWGRDHVSAHFLSGGCHMTPMFRASSVVSVSCLERKAQPVCFMKRQFGHVQTTFSPRLPCVVRRGDRENGFKPSDCLVCHFRQWASSIMIARTRHDKTVCPNYKCVTLVSIARKGSVVCMRKANLFCLAVNYCWIRVS